MASRTPLKELLDEEIYPALYEHIDKALPEFGFKLNGKGWQSTNTYKIDGREGGKKTGQVFVYKNSPAFLKDHSEEKAITIDKYFQDVKGLTWMQAVKLFAETTGIKLPTKELSEAELAKIREANRKAEIWEIAQEFFVSCINNPKYKDQAKDVIQYLIISRKYTLPDVGAMQLGYIPNQEALRDHLQSKGVTTDEIKDFVTLNVWIGNTHKLTIPFRNRYGKIEGIAARNVNHRKDHKLEKYQNSTGLKRSELLFNLPRKAVNGRVILVEGQLDAGIATARDFNTGSVAAIGGKDITEAQINQIKAAGAKEVIICLDNEEATKKSIQRAISLFHKLTPEIDVFVAELPEGIKDTDELITNQGIEVFTDVIKKALADYNYQLFEVLPVYSKYLEDQNALTDLQESALLEKVEAIAAGITNPNKHQNFYSRFIDACKQYGLNISKESFEAAAERLRFKADQEKQSQELKDLLHKAEQARAAGRPFEAITDIEENLRSIKLRDKKTLYREKLNKKLTKSALIDKLKNTPPSLRTGFKIKIDGELEDIQIIAGGLNFFVSATNHGKTLALINTALNILTDEEYKKKNIHLFTYEESEVKMNIYILNTFIDTELNKRANQREVIKQFLLTGSDQFISNEENIKKTLQDRTDEYFRDFVETGRLNVHYMEDNTAEGLISFMEHITSEDPHAVFLVDYIQKLRSTKAGNASHRPTELKFIAEDLNDFAIRTGAPVALAAQFAREVKSPLEMLPQNIAEGSDIEKVAAEIIGLWNCTKKTRALSDKENNEIFIKYGGAKIGELIIIAEVLKSRSLPTGHSCNLDYNGKTGKLSQNKSLLGWGSGW